MLLIAYSALAQTMEPRFTAGVTSFADEGAVNHLTLGGSLRVFLSRRWSVEPEFLYMRYNRFVRDRDYVLWGNVAFDFLRRGHRFVPYWFAAPGLVYHRSSFGQQTFSNAEAAVATGGGLRVYLSDRVFVAPQVRAGLADGVFGEFTGSIGFVLR